MTIADVLFWGGVGGGILGGLWYGLKTHREKGGFRAGQGSPDRYKIASHTAKNDHGAGHYDEYRRDPSKEEPRAIPRSNENERDRFSGGGGGGTSRRGFDDDNEPDAFRSGNEGNSLTSVRFEVSELRREIERLARSFDELNSEVTRRINRANARLARSKPEDPGNGQADLPIQEAGGIRLKSDLRKIAQERILAKRGIRR